MQNGGDINKQDITGYSPLHSAARNGHLGCVKYLVDLGVDVKCLSKKGNTALCVAKTNSHKKVAEYLSTCSKFMKISMYIPLTNHSQGGGGQAGSLKLINSFKENYGPELELGIWVML